MITDERMAQIRKLLYQDPNCDVDIVGYANPDDKFHDKEFERIAKNIGISTKELKQYVRQFSTYCKTLK